MYLCVCMCIYIYIYVHTYFRRRINNTANNTDGQGNYRLYEEAPPPILMRGVLTMPIVAMVPTIPLVFVLIILTFRRRIDNTTNNTDGQCNYKLYEEAPPLVLLLGTTCLTLLV